MKKLLLILFFLCSKNLIYAQDIFSVITKQYMKYDEQSIPKITGIVSGLRVTVRISPGNIIIENDKTEQYIEYPISNIMKDDKSTLYFCNEYDVVLVRYADKLEIMNTLHKTGKIYYFNPDKITTAMNSSN